VRLTAIQMTSVFAPLEKCYCYTFSSSGQIFNNYIQLYTGVEKEENVLEESKATIMFRNSRCSFHPYSFAFHSPSIIWQFSSEIL